MIRENLTHIPENTNCCLTSTYCYNDGKCRKSKSPLTKTRASCECKEGFVGERCEKKAKSCQSYRDLSDGWYKIFTNDDNQVKVYCQLGPVNIWTLVMSYSLKFNEHYKNKAYYKNSPRNEMNETWEDHRLSFNAMKSIKEDGNMLWRITCSYGEKGWNETDIVIATHENAPVFKKIVEPPECLNVRSIDIRGYKCKDCQIPFWQDDKQIFHTDNTQGKVECNLKGFELSVCKDQAEGGEDNFGFYQCCNTKHRCSSSDKATTQLWFGQRMKFN
ncbi:uncharacterized protein LOC124455391 [Xenia sp. Carnegie-2017]|uniref:uncharacterized protein LOC124455391 n=1 Tax=Xenia sp. Carnegie-2017 TaxID=2897299 RepID=UPI001F045544|nr:uncharacterized protein LOC124455391 [Xenia sp. Carnegie-2017]